MPKLKTRKSTSKRFRMTATGRIVRRRANKGHLLTSKTRKRKRNLRRASLVSSVDQRRIRRQLAQR
jgi:large subunit ribosomal protein L35